jgi:hypothetical protein
MIFDKRLKLAENFDIVSTRNISGVKQSDLFPILSLGEVGRGEQLFCCVTVRESFDIPAGDPTYLKLSLKEEWFTYTGYIDSVIQPGLGDAAARHAHNRQPILASSGYIELSAGGVNNFAAGKKFTFAINPITNNQVATVLNIGAQKYSGSSYAYFLLEEFTSSVIATDFTPADNISTGKIDVDIVTIAEGGAGTGFSDCRYYSTRTIVK